MSAIYECECDSFEMYEEQDSFEMAEAVPGPGVPPGGLTGQVLKKRSDADYDTEWADESGGGGTSDYTQLSNKPQINGNTLTGNKSGADLGLVNAETGKGLSTNDYTTADKTKLAGIEAQANKTVIDSTLTNAGQAADAKKTGDEISDLKNTLTQLGTNVTALETETATIEQSMAIIVNGNTSTSNVKPGQYVYLKNSTISGLTDELYTYTGSSTKTAGNSFISSELAAVSSGGLNDLFYRETVSGTTANPGGWVNVGNRVGYHLASVSVVTPDGGYMGIPAKFGMVGAWLAYIITADANNNVKVVESLNVQLDLIWIKY